MADEQVYSKRINLYVGPGGPTCPCCNVGNSKVRTRKMRAARRSERQRARQAHEEEAAMIGIDYPAEREQSFEFECDYDLVEQGKHHTDWWTWWLLGADEDDDYCFRPALFEGWGGP